MKIKNIVLISAVLVPSLMLASGGGEHHEVTMWGSDFKYRVLNFALFVGLLYYLVANPIKAFFAGRTEGIANQLKEIEEKLQASKNQRLEAEENLKLAEQRAGEIVEDAGKEAKILAGNIVEKNDTLLTSLEKQAVEKQAFESKKFTRETIDSVLNGGLNSDDITVDESKVVSLVSKKVA